MTPRHKLRIAAMIAALAGLSLAISAMPGATAAPPAASLMRAEFTWSGDGGPTNTLWDWPCNWVHFICAENGPYPDGINDTATFPWKTTGAWDCDLITEEIGNLTIAGNVDFDTDGGAVTLNAAKLIISPTTGDIEITMTGTAKIEVD